MSLLYFSSSLGAQVSSMRKDHPHYALHMLYVTAKPETIQRRIEQRGQATGRYVPWDKVNEALQHVPTNVATLAPLLDYFEQVDNEDA
jgi:hypothetical protein